MIQPRHDRATIQPVMTVLGLDPRINPVIFIGWLLTGIASFAIGCG
jgi:hypothetical protein